MTMNLSCLVGPPYFARVRVFARLACSSPSPRMPRRPRRPKLLASWNEGPAKQAIVDFVKATTDTSSPNFVPPEERIATFDQDGTLWVEHPMYSQVVYCLDRVPALVKAKPELAEVEPFKTVLSGDREAMAKLSTPDLEKILFGHTDRHDGGHV